MSARDKKMGTPIVVAGLSNSGKTTFICSLIQLGYQFKLNLAAFKPFDTGLLERNAEERSSDGDQFCGVMTGEPAETLVAPYIAHESYPLEMSLRRDGIKIDWSFIKERMRILNDLYDRTLVELPPSLFTPITEDKLAHEWLRETSCQIIWLIHPLLSQFEQNLAEIHLLKDLEIQYHLVMNNASKNTNQDLLFYVWEKIEKFSGQQLEGMIPYLRHPDNLFVKLGSKLEENLPSIINRLLKQNS